MQYTQGEEFEEGRKLAKELIRHGIKDRDIAAALGVTTNCIYRWRQAVRRDGWTENEIEAYDDPEELKRKLRELEGYKGLYSAKDIHERLELKMHEAQELFEQGYSLNKITEKNECLLWDGTSMERHTGI